MYLTTTNSCPLRCAAICSYTNTQCLLKDSRRGCHNRNESASKKDPYAKYKLGWPPCGTAGRRDHTDIPCCRFRLCEPVVKSDVLSGVNCNCMNISHIFRCE